MSLTYPHGPTEPVGDRIETPRFSPANEEPFVPVYARRGKARSGKGKIRTWMILVPVGLLTLGGIGAMMAMNGGDEASASLAEPAATLPVLSTPSFAPGSEAAPLGSASTPSPVITGPSVREAAPTPRAAPARRTAAPAATPVAQTPDPVVAAGPQPYATSPAAPSTSASAPAAPAPTTTSPPAIIIDPAG